jgi:hypothetical protein
MKKMFVFIVVFFAFGVFLVRSSSVLAEQSGVGHYVPGALADFGDMAPPGLAFANWVNYYHGSAGAGRTLPIGVFVGANIKANHLRRTVWRSLYDFF